jgi:phosphatidylserine/phosphatidylglycerophosphate/cardiolipin synthase-like enzyme
MVDDAQADFSNLTLGTDHPVREVDTSEAVSRACLALISKASREIVIMTRDLDPKVFDDSEIISALRDFLLSSRRVRLRILLKQPDAIARRGHRLLELTQRLTSFTEIRVPAAEFSTHNTAYVVVDEVGILYRSFADRFEASVSFNDRNLAREKMREFEEIWQTSAEAASLRRISL